MTRYDRKKDEEMLRTGLLDGSAPPLDMNTAEPTLPPEVQERLGDELRKHYASLVAQPLPERFIELLQKLAESEEDRGQS